MKRLNGNLARGMIIAAFTIGFGGFVSKEVWIVKSIYEIKKDMAVVLDNEKEHVDMRADIEELKIEVTKLTTLKQ